MTQLPLRDPRPLTLAASRPVREAIERIDAGGAGIALLVDDDGRLVATVTDGDVRRALLRGSDISVPALSIASRAPILAPQTITRAEAVRLMHERGIRQLPLIDAAGHPAGLLLDSDLIAAARAEPVVVMAGGRGSRLGALTGATPKPLVAVGGSPILETLLTQLVGEGFTNFLFAVNYLSDRIVEHFGDGSRFGASIEYLREPEALGTAGALRLAIDRLDRTFLVLNADILTTVRFVDIVDAHHRCGNLLTMALSETEISLRYGVVRVENDRVVSLEEKPTIRTLANAGIYVADPAILRYLPEGRSTMPEVVSTLLAAGEPVGHFTIRDLWLDIGELSDLERAHALMARMRGGDAS